MRRILLLAKRYYKQLFMVVGTAGALDLLKEFGRAKLMDLAYEHLGGIGPWLLDYPFAVLTLTLIAILLFLAVTAILESCAKTTSKILDARHRPYETTRLSKEWGLGFSVIAVLIAMLLGFGAQRYYWIKSAPDIAITAYEVVLSSPNTNPFTNVYFENIGGEGQVKVYFWSALAPNFVHPKIAIQEGDKTGAESFAVRPLEKHWFTIFGPVPSSEQARLMKNGQYSFFFGGMIVATGKTTRTYSFCHSVIGNEARVILDCPEN